MPTLGSISAALNPLAPRPYKEGRAFEQSVILTLTDNYIAGGVVADLTGLDTPGLNAPFKWEFYPQAGDTYHYVKVNDRSDGKIVAYTGATAHTDDSAWAEATLKATFWYNPIGQGA